MKTPIIEVETEVITENPLTVAVANSGLEPKSAQDIKLAFAPIFDQAEEWRIKALAIKVTDASQTATMKLAREARLALKELRVKGDHAHKELKADTLLRGKAIDGIRNIVKFLIEPVEAYLQEQEQFIERQEQKRRAELKAEREEALRYYGVDTEFLALDAMPQPSFDRLMKDTEEAHANKLIAAQKAKEDADAAEEMRIAKVKADAEQRELIRVENERLKAEAEVARKQQEQRDEATRKEAAEALRIQGEKDAKAKFERDAIIEKARKQKAAADKVIADQKAELQRQQDVAAAKANNERLEREAAAAAPDKQKIAAFAAVVRALQVPEFATKKGKLAQADIAAKVEGFAKWIEGREV